MCKYSKPYTILLGSRLRASAFLSESLQNATAARSNKVGSEAYHFNYLQIKKTSPNSSNKILLICGLKNIFNFK